MASCDRACGVAPGCFSPFLLSSRASSCPVTGCGLPGTGNAGFETRDRAPQRKTLVVCHDSPLRFPSHNVRGQESDARPENLSVYARHSPLGNFVWQEDFGRKAWCPRRFFGRCGKRDSLLRPKFETSKEMGWLRHARLLPVSCLSIV